MIYANNITNELTETMGSSAQVVPTVQYIEKVSLCYIEDVPADQRDLFDYHENLDDAGQLFFNYRGNWYDLSQFTTDLPRIVSTAHIDGEDVEIVWEGYEVLMHGVAVVVNTQPVCFEDMIYVGYWC